LGVGSWVISLREISGVDLVESLSKEVSKQPITVGFLVQDQHSRADCRVLTKKVSGLKVGLVSQEWSEDFKNKKIDILFIAFGSPKQEIGISDNLEKLPAKVIIVCWFF